MYTIILITLFMCAMKVWWFLINLKGGKKLKFCILQVYNVVRIKRFDAVYLGKGFFFVRGVNSNGYYSLSLKAVYVHINMHGNQNQDMVSKMEKYRDKECVQKLKPRFGMRIFPLQVKYVATAPLHILLFERSLLIYIFNFVYIHSPKISPYN